MWKGSVISLHIAKETKAPMQTVEIVHAIPGRGIEGDRYFLGTGHFSEHFGKEHEITLIEVETIQALNAEHEELANFQAAEARRNVVTKDVPLNHLVGHEFQVGEVRLRGMRLCDPCLHIAQITHHFVLSGLVHRGGLRAQILTEGYIRVDDPIIDLGVMQPQKDPVYSLIP